MAEKDEDVRIDFEKYWLRCFVCYRLNSLLHLKFPSDLFGSFYCTNCGRYCTKDEVLLIDKRSGPDRLKDLCPVLITCDHCECKGINHEFVRPRFMACTKCNCKFDYYTNKPVTEEEFIRDANK